MKRSQYIPIIGVLFPRLQVLNWLEGPEATAGQLISEKVVCARNLHSQLNYRVIPPVAVSDKHL